MVNMMTGDRKPFFPRDKPKSWVLFISSVLIGILVLTPSILIAHFVGLNVVVEIIKFVLLAMGGFGFVMGIVFNYKLLRGKYRNLSSRPWSDQEW